MHTVIPYSIRVHDPSLPGPLMERYHEVNDIRKIDLLDSLKEFITANSVFSQIGNENRTLRYDTPTVDGRNIYGWIECGDYGLKSKIIDVNSHKTVYTKKTTDSDINMFFYHIHIPKKSKRGICLFHNVHGRGVKTFFDDAFKDFFKNKSKGLLPQLKPILYEKALEEWMKSSIVKEIQILEPKASNDKADNTDEYYKTTVYKSNRGKSFGRLKDFIKNGKTNNNNEFIESLVSEEETVRVIASLDGRKKIINLSSTSPTTIIEIDETDVNMRNGTPEKTSLYNFSKKIIEEII